MKKVDTAKKRRIITWIVILIVLFILLTGLCLFIFSDMIRSCFSSANKCSSVDSVESIQKSKEIMISMECMEQRMRSMEQRMRSMESMEQRMRSMESMERMERMELRMEQRMRSMEQRMERMELRKKSRESVKENMGRHIMYSMAPDDLENARKKMESDR